MADAANAAQRNLYPRHDGTRYAASYKDGSGKPYSEAMRSLSWPVPTDVPGIGQQAAVIHLPELKQVYGLTTGQLYLHPTTYTKLRHTDHLSYTKSMGRVGIGHLANPKQDVYSRLYLGSKSMARTPTRLSQGRFEMAADVAFQDSMPEDAVALYSKAISQAGTGAPNIFAYEKRCAALAELGRYREALVDAEYILKWNDGPGEKGAALMRVKAIKDFMRRTDNFEKGYHNATSTLICLLRPREHRQLVQSNPSNYGRPETAERIGKGLSPSASMGALLNFDADGDGEIDMDEFKRGMRTMGYKVLKQESAAFKGSGDQRGYI